MEINQELSEIIKKALPQHVGEELKKELADLERIRLLTSRQENKILGLTTENKELMDRNKAWLDLERSLTDREKTVTKREADVQHLEHREELMQVKLNCAESKTQFASNTLSTVFRNTVLRESLMRKTTDTTTSHGQDYNGNPTTSVETRENMNPIDQERTED